MLPFLIGQGLKRLLQKPAPTPVRYIPSACVVLTVWMSMSASRGTLLSLAAGDILAIALGALAVHLTLLALSYLAGRLLRLDAPDSLAVLFVVSQKTLPLAISVLAALQVSIASAMVVCILYHFVQLMLDSALAVRLRIRTTAA